MVFISVTITTLFIHNFILYFFSRVHMTIQIMFEDQLIASTDFRLPDLEKVLLDIPEIQIIHKPVNKIFMARVS